MKYTKTYKTLCVGFQLLVYFNLQKEKCFNFISNIMNDNMYPVSQSTAFITIVFFFIVINFCYYLASFVILIKLILHA